MDPFCGVGTMLIERDIRVPAREKYGTDIFGEAIDKARENASAAGELIHFIHRDFFDFRHEYKFDAVSYTHLNKSVRDFDIVTYDRVKRIYIEEDFSAWKEYAYKAQIHGAILSYLEIKKKNFYSIVSDLDGKRFVTARGWEDLSQVMKVYEQLHLSLIHILYSKA